MRVDFVDVAGVRTRLLQGGTGPALLLLHPVGFSADVWVHNFAKLGESFAVYAPDLLGHGFSDLAAGSGAIGVAEMLDHLTALIDILGLENLSICGSSLGGQLGALLYLRMPHRVNRLIIVGSGTTVQTSAQVIATLEKTRANAMRAFAAPSWDNCITRLANLCFDPALDFSPLILSQLTAYARAGAAEAYEKLLNTMSDPQLAERFSVRRRLHEIAVPALLLWGRQDPRANHAIAVEALKLMPAARLITIETCGHLPYFEHPAIFNQVITNFLLQD